MHLDHRYIEYLRKGDSNGITSIYNQFAPRIIQMVELNNGTRQDASDVIQEALLSIYKVTMRKDFVLTCPFDAFFYMVCKRKWLSHLTKKSNTPRIRIIDDRLSDNPSRLSTTAEALADEVEREQIVMKVLDTMGEKCRKIIRACMTKEHQEKIAEQLGFTYAFLRKKKSECMTQLGMLVRNHPFFKSESHEQSV